MASSSDYIAAYLSKLDLTGNDSEVDYSERLHDQIVSLINGEQYDHLVDLCQEILQFDLNTPLIQKVVFTLINLNVADKAISICKAYLKLEPTHPLVIEIVDDFLRYNNYRGAIDTCKMYLLTNKEDVLEILPKYLIRFLESDEHNYNTFELIEIFFALNPNRSMIYRLIQSSIDLRNYQATVFISNLLLDLNLDEIDTLRDIVMLLMDNGQIQEAGTICKKILKYYPNTPKSLTLYGIVLISRGEFHKALSVFNDLLLNASLTNKALKGRILNYIGRVHLCLGDLKKASSVLRKAIKFNPKLPNPYWHLGFANFKNGYNEKGINLIEKAIQLDRNYSGAWATLGSIHYELDNYDLAFKACYSCLSINNQNQEGIKLYKKLAETPTLIILNYIVAKLKKLGYRCGFDDFNEHIFPTELLEKRGFISYSKEYHDFLKGANHEFFDNVVAIYSWLPTCDKCKGPLKLYGERVDFKTKQRTSYYRCKKCDHEISEVRDLEASNIFNIKVKVVLKSVNCFSERKNNKVNFSKLDREKLFITYTPFDEIVRDPNAYLDLLISLKSAVLLYGKDIR
ncbi:MAG: tetratricopeptide repeat protein [Candidatus Hermodarchaeota archaeon]